MIPYGRQDISSDDLEAVMSVLRSDWLTQGPVVPRFEQATASYVGAQFGVASNSATSSLQAACKALGVGPGDRVWTSPNTFVATANAAQQCGAIVDFVDIDPETYNLCTHRLSKKLQQANDCDRLPKLVIPVHFAGQPCDMPRIRELSQVYGFKILEDASHAVGATYSTNRLAQDPLLQDQTTYPIGSCAHSDITVFSFHPVKIITTGEGGMAVTNDPILAEKMARYRSHGITSKLDQMENRPTDEIWNYQQIDIGFNHRMTDLQAALGITQLTRISSFLKKRRELAHNYNSKLAHLPIILPKQRPETQSSYHLYPIRVPQSLSSTNQRKVYQYLTNSGIAANLHYIPVYRHPYYARFGFQPGYCPESESYYKEVISLPIYPGLAEHQQQRVIDTLNNLFQ